MSAWDDLCAETAAHPPLDRLIAGHATTLCPLCGVVGCKPHAWSRMSPSARQRLTENPDPDEWHDQQRAQDLMEIGATPW